MKRCTRAWPAGLDDRKSSMQSSPALSKRSLTVLAECRPRKRGKPLDVRPFAPLFKALGDETRLEILALLANVKEPLCVCEIEAHFDLSQPTISHHLKILRKVGVLSSERRGTWMYYSIERETLARIEQFSAAFE